MGLMARLSSLMPKPNAVSRKLIVGLGNPGKEYEHTRHNIGFLVIDAMQKSAKTILLKPQTFMNRSGEEVGKTMHYYKIPLENLIVVHDDVDLPFGNIIVKKGQGAAGHNGVKSIMETLGSEDFWRVRVGIGRPTNANIPLEDWVLGQWTQEEREKLDALVEEVVQRLKNEEVEQ